MSLRKEDSLIEKLTTILAAALLRLSATLSASELSSGASRMEESPGRSVDEPAGESPPLLVPYGAPRLGTLMKALEDAGAV